MELDEQTSLVDRAAIVVAASVWYHEDIIENIRAPKSGYKCFYLHYWENTRDKVKENIHKLPLTASTKQRVEYFSVFAARGIMGWLTDNYYLTINSTVLPSVLCWNPKGTINFTATAEKAIFHEINILNCFRVACLYCLEAKIFPLWDLIEEYYGDPDEGELFEVRFWISYIRHNLNTFMDEIQYIGNRDTLLFAFNISVTNNNEIWTEHFLNKMREDQKCAEAYNKLKNILEMSVANNYKMIPKLSKYVSDEMFNELILNYPGIILIQFLQFPDTSRFLQIADKTRDILINDDFYIILEKIGHALQKYGGHEIFQNILQQFWSISHDHCKNYVIRKCTNASFLNRLSLLEFGTPIVKLIIQSSTMDQRKEMLFSYNGILFCDGLFKKSKWSCFSMIIQEFVGSEDIVTKINELISTYQHIFESNRFPTLTSKDFQKIIEVLEKLKDTYTCLSK